MIRKFKINKHVHKIEIVKFTTEDGQVGTLCKMNVEGLLGTFIGAAVLSPHDEENTKLGTYTAIKRAVEDMMCTYDDHSNAISRKVLRMIDHSWRQYEFEHIMAKSIEEFEPIMISFAEATNNLITKFGEALKNLFGELQK